MEWQIQIVEDILWAGSIDNGVPDDRTSPAPKHLYHCSAPCELIHKVRYVCKRYRMGNIAHALDERFA